MYGVPCTVSSDVHVTCSVVEGSSSSHRVNSGWCVQYLFSPYNDSLSTSSQPISTSASLYKRGGYGTVSGNFTSPGNWHPVNTLYLSVNLNPDPIQVMY